MLCPGDGGGGRLPVIFSEIKVHGELMAAGAPHLDGVPDPLELLDLAGFSEATARADDHRVVGRGTNTLISSMNGQAPKKLKGNNQTKTRPGQAVYL